MMQTEYRSRAAAWPGSTSAGEQPPGNHRCGQPAVAAARTRSQDEIGDRDQDGFCRSAIQGFYNRDCLAASVESRGGRI